MVKIIYIVNALIAICGIHQCLKLDLILIWTNLSRRFGLMLTCYLYISRMSYLCSYMHITVYTNRVLCINIIMSINKIYVLEHEHQLVYVTSNVIGFSDTLKCVNGGRLYTSGNTPSCYCPISKTGISCQISKSRATRII